MTDDIGLDLQNLAELPLPEPLPDWVKALLFELYHPLGPRRMAEALAPVSRLLAQFAQAINRFQQEAE